MSPPNFSIYLNSLLSIKREDNEDRHEQVLSNLEDWGYIEANDGMVLVTKKGKVLKCYLKNREFIASSIPQIQETVLKGYTPSNG